MTTAILALIYSGDIDDTVRLWDVAIGMELRRLAHTGMIRGYFRGHLAGRHTAGLRGCQ